MWAQACTPAQICNVQGTSLQRQQLPFRVPPRAPRVFAEHEPRRVRVAKRLQQARSPYLSPSPKMQLSLRKGAQAAIPF